MTIRTQRLPPLNALRVFHVVVRHRSFRSAAVELSVSPQAVSQQIKLLEDTLGLELFERKGRTVLPNDQALLLSHHVQSAFDELAEGVRRVTKTTARSRININASPYFATRYLLDRLAKFRDIMPEADVRLTTMVELPDFVSDDVDVAIQWGFGDWKPYESHLLMRDYKQICCTPQLARLIKTPQDLLNVPLLHLVLSKDLWGPVLTHLGVTAGPSGSEYRFQDAATMRRGALAGLGVGLLSTLDAEEDLKLGKLVAPFGRDIMKSMPEAEVPGFYLVLPKAHRRVKPIMTFYEWIQAENWQSVESRLV